MITGQLNKRSSQRQDAAKANRETLRELFFNIAPVMPPHK